MKYPIRILSDLHLGHPASLIDHVEQLRPLITGAGTVIFNGDTWQELAKTMQSRSGAMLTELKSLCAEEGVETVFLPGNHDPSISDQNLVELDGGRIVILHGQVIFPEVSPWSNYYFAKQQEVKALLDEKLPLAKSIDDRFLLAKEVVQLMTPKRWVPKKSKFDYYLNTVWPPKRFWTLLRVRKTALKASGKFCQEFFPAAKVVVLGHFHRTFIQKGEDLTLINTGAFMSGCDFQYVELRKSHIEVVKVVKNKRKGCFCKA